MAGGFLSMHNAQCTVQNDFLPSAEVISLPRGEGGFFGFAEKDGRGITKNPEGSLPCAKGGVANGDGRVSIPSN